MREGSIPSTAAMQSILYSYTPKELQDLLDSSYGYADLLRKVGLNPKGKNPDTLKKIINEYNLDVTQLDNNRRILFSNCARNVNKGCRYDIEDILNNKYPNYQSSKLLKRLLESGYKEYRCEECGISSWMDKPITLQLHHIDGNHTNNNLNNLSILCPNCHTQTDTYGGKSSNKSKEKILKDKLDNTPMKKISKRPHKEIPVSREVLKDKIRNTPFVSIAKEYGITDNAVRKWCDRYGLPRKVSVIKTITEEEWKNI